jgi:hypothetical protein
VAVSVPTDSTTISWEGKMIQCQGGSGNCGNGTGCIATESGSNT